MISTLFHLRSHDNNNNLSKLFFDFYLLQLHTKPLRELVLQNAKFEASTLFRLEVVNFVALAHTTYLAKYNITNISNY